MIDNPQTDQAALRDRIAEALMRWAEGNNDPQYARMRRSETVRANAYSRADAVLAAVLPAVPVPPATHATDELAAATCSAQYHGDEDGARLCIRAAQHTGKSHTDEHGFHWSDTVAVYPLDDGTFRTGVNLRAELRRMADEAQQQPDTETPTEEQIVRDHVTSLHLIGEQLADIENWMWRHLADVRDASGPGRVADEEQPETGEVVHACPPDGSGLTPCCGRTPFELPLGDRISSEAPVTCPGAPR